MVMTVFPTPLFSSASKRLANGVMILNCPNRCDDGHESLLLFGWGTTVKCLFWSPRLQFCGYFGPLRKDLSDCITSLGWRYQDTSISLWSLYKKPLRVR